MWPTPRPGSAASRACSRTRAAPQGAAWAACPRTPAKLPTPVGEKHDEEALPSTAFTSYDQWKEYLADKKKAAQDAEELARAKKRVEEQPLVNDDKALLQAGQGDAYLQLIAELDDLKERARQNQQLQPAPGSMGDGNLVRFDKMFVSGFETLPYDAVIPHANRAPTWIFPVWTRPSAVSPT